MNNFLQGELVKIGGDYFSGNYIINDIDCITSCNTKFFRYHLSCDSGCATDPFSPKRLHDLAGRPKIPTGNFFWGPQQNFNYYGFDVDINSGNYVAISAPQENLNDNKKNVGAVYIYKHISGTDWELTKKLYGSSPFGHFGHNIVLNYSGNRLFVSEPFYGGVNNVNNTFLYESGYGAVYVFNKSGNNETSAEEWLLETILSGFGEYNANFGYSIDTDKNGNRLIVGAPGFNVLSNQYQVGQYQIAITTGLDKLYISNNTGITWNKKENDRYWQSVAINGDGRYQVAIPNSGHVYVSNNFGETWSQKDDHFDRSNTNIKNIILSDDGRYQLTTIRESSSRYKIRNSNNFGESWRTRFPSLLINSCLDMSTDGKYQIAGSYFSLFVSEDYGQSWTEKVLPSGYITTSVKIFNNGKDQYATSYYGDMAGSSPGHLFRSTDYGNTWFIEKLNLGGGIGGIGISVSNNVQFQFLTKEFSDTVSVSNDFGLSFTDKNVNAVELSNQIISYNGEYQIGIGHINFSDIPAISISKDYGNTWINRYDFKILDINKNKSLSKSKVFIYNKQDSNWVPNNVLSSQDENTFFGDSVSISDNGGKYIISELSPQKFNIHYYNNNTLESIIQEDVSPNLDLRKKYHFSQYTYMSKNGSGFLYGLPYLNSGVLNIYRTSPFLQVYNLNYLVPNYGMSFALNEQNNFLYYGSPSENSVYFISGYIFDTGKRNFTTIENFFVENLSFFSGNENGPCSKFLLRNYTNNLNGRLRLTITGSVDDDLVSNHA